MKNNLKMLVLLLLIILVVVVIVFVKGGNPLINNKQTEPRNLDFIEAMTDLSTDISFAHVVPGEYSEVYFLLKGGVPGESRLLTLEGPSVVSDKDQRATFNNRGEAKFTWRVDRYGEYGVYEDVYDSTTMQDEPILIQSVVVE